MTELEKFVRKYPQHEDEAIERAAIMEYDGGLCRPEAEQKAVIRLKDKYNLNQGELFDSNH